MNQISENLLRAVDLVVSNQISKIKFDQTIQGTIQEVINKNTGEYKINYNNNVFSAYTLNTAIIYQEGDKVYVKIPEGDYSNKKLIEGKVSINSSNDNSSNIGNTGAITQEIEILKPYWHEIYNYNWNYVYSLVAGLNKTSKNIFSSSGDYDDSLLINYNKYYDKIQIKASFRNDLKDYHNQGNYGLKVVYQNQENEDITLILDLASFSGSPYEFINYAEQSIMFEIKIDTFKSLKSIDFFQENFIPDSNNTENLFVTNIEISFIELADYSNSKYYLTILKPKGTSFINTDLGSLPLIGSLKMLGEEILTKDNCECYWYKEDLEIVFNNENYDELAGTGWRKISENVDFKTLTVYKEKIQQDQRYKIVVIHEDNILSKEITVTFNEVNFELREDNGYVKIFDKSKNNWYNKREDWYRRTESNAYEAIIGNPQTQVSIQSNLMGDYTTFYCKITDDDGNLLTNQFLLIYNDESTFKVSFKGTELYHYNANGNITINNPQLSKDLAVVLFSSVALISWEINGVKIGYTPISPNNSMMYNIWVDTDNTIHYNVRETYKQNCFNNTFTVKITLFNGQILSFNKEILFIKDGEQGTNGTGYVCIIAPCDANGEKLIDFTGLRYSQNSFLQDLRLKAFLYKNGQLLNDTNSIVDNFTFKWESRDTDIFTVVSSQISDQCIIRGQSLPTNFTNYLGILKLTVRVTDNGNNFYIYNNYPIPILVNISEPKLLEINIPNSIRYSSLGVNPEYTNQPLLFKYDNIDYSENIVSQNLSLLEINNKTSNGKTEYYLNPVDYFYFNSGIGVLKCSISSNQYVIYPIMMYLNTYGNQAINDWDGTTIVIDEDSGTILAPQIGAGIKENGKFTGVIMGKDQGQELVGLYGYQQGICSFSFTEDGNATIGKSGSGQIQINGNNGWIQSGNYETSDGTEGMRIDLQNGEIIAYDFSLKSSYLNISNNNFQFDLNTEGKFIINGLNQPLLYISNNQYYLQTDDYDGNNGIKIDLKNGSIDINKGSININNNFIVTENGTVTIQSANEEEGIFASINLSFSNIKTEIKDLEGNFSTLEQTVDHFITRVEDLEGNYSELQQTVNGFTFTVSNLEGQFSKLEQTVDGFIFSDETGGTTGINGDSIITGTINLDAVKLNSEYGGFTVGYGSASGWDTTRGAKMYGSAGETGPFYIIVTNAGCRMQAYDAFFTVISTGLAASSEIAIASDKRLKHDISYNLDILENLYFNLQPALFTLNNNYNNELTIGLIAQDVENSIAKDTELFEKKLSFLSVPNDKDTSYLSIKYGELISLNIHMIQKLYKEKNSIEKEIAILKEEILKMKEGYYIDNH